jgi:hypothetical protein
VGTPPQPGDFTPTHPGVPPNPDSIDAPERRVWVMADGVRMSGAVPRTGTCAAYTTAKSICTAISPHAGDQPCAKRVSSDRESGDHEAGPE